MPRAWVSGPGVLLASFWELWEVPGLYFGSPEVLLASISELLGYHFRSRGCILGALGLSWGPFWGFWGTILGALGPSWALWGALGAHKAPHGRPETNCGSILETCLVHFGDIFGQCFG